MNKRQALLWMQKIAVLANSQEMQGQTNLNVRKAMLGTEPPTVNPKEQQKIDTASKNIQQTNSQAPTQSQFALDTVNKATPVVPYGKTASLEYLQKTSAMGFGGKLGFGPDYISIKQRTQPGQTRVQTELSNSFPGQPVGTPPPPADTQTTGASTTDPTQGTPSQTTTGKKNRAPTGSAILDQPK